MRLYCDNKLAINIAHNSIQHDRTKHIEIAQHLIKEYLKNGFICTPYVPTRKQMVNILTKGLANLQFEKIISKLGMINISIPASLRGVIKINNIL